MSAFLVAALRIAFLALIWLFILAAGNIIRTDIFGHRVDEQGNRLRGRRARRAEAEAAAREQQQDQQQDQQPAEQPAITRATRLVVTEGKNSGHEYPLNGVMGLGRAASQSILVDDDYSSSRHAQLAPGGDGTWILEDLGSTNGTYVNGVRITQPTRLGVDDVIRIGRTQMRLAA